jgi:hypothetical protein
MNSCLRHFGTQEEQDDARAEWFSKLQERQRQRQQEADEKKENEAKLKEWWGMDENWNRLKEPKKIDIDRATAKKGNGG